MKKRQLNLILIIANLCYLNIGYTQDNNKKNISAGCDSTCMINAGQISTSSNFQQRVVACISGFSGTKLQTRVKGVDEKWSDWKDKDVDNCTCSPTSKTQMSICEEPLKGNIIEKSNWTCTNAKSGVWSEWTADKSGCYTPCEPLPDENRNASCPAGYTGSKTEKRTSSCSNGESKPPVWSQWTTVTSTCKQQVCVRSGYQVTERVGWSPCHSNEAFAGYRVYADMSIILTWNAQSGPFATCVSMDMTCLEWK